MLVKDQIAALTALKAKYDANFQLALSAGVAAQIAALSKLDPNTEAAA